MFNIAILLLWKDSTYYLEKHSFLSIKLSPYWITDRTYLMKENTSNHKPLKELLINPFVYNTSKDVLGGTKPTTH